MAASTVIQSNMFSFKTSVETSRELLRIRLHFTDLANLEGLRGFLILEGSVGGNSMILETGFLAAVLTPTAADG